MLLVHKGVQLQDHHTLRRARIENGDVVVVVFDKTKYRNAVNIEMERERILREKVHIKQERPERKQLATKAAVSVFVVVVQSIGCFLMLLFILCRCAQLLCLLAPHAKQTAQPTRAQTPLVSLVHSDRCTLAILRACLAFPTRIHTHTHTRTRTRLLCLRLRALPWPKLQQQQQHKHPRDLRKYKFRGRQAASPLYPLCPLCLQPLLLALLLQLLLLLVRPPRFRLVFLLFLAP